jgi:hypothetical protein
MAVSTVDDEPEQREILRDFPDTRAVQAGP